MAYADYYHCDVCDCKVFYDAGLKYGDRIGGMAVICTDCAKTYEVRVVELQPEPEEQSAAPSALGLGRLHGCPTCGRAECSCGPSQSENDVQA